MRGFGVGVRVGWTKFGQVGGTKGAGRVWTKFVLLRKIRDNMGEFLHQNRKSSDLHKIISR